MKKSVNLIRCIVLLLYLGLFYIACELQDNSSNVRSKVERSTAE